MLTKISVAMSVSEKYECRIHTGCLMLLARQVTCEEISQCYNDVGICLWTNGSQLTQSESAAERVCQQRNNSFLPRVTDSNIQHKLAMFRNATNSPRRQGSLGNNAFWIDVRAVHVSSWHWIDNSPFAGLFAVCG